MKFKKREDFVRWRLERVHEATVVGDSLKHACREKPRTFHVRLDQIHPFIRIAHSGRVHELRERIVRDHQLLLVVSGTGHLVMKSKKIAFHPGDLLFIPPYVRHHFAPDDPKIGDHLSIHFDLTQDFPQRDKLPSRANYRVKFEGNLSIPSHFVTSPENPIRASLFDIVSHFSRGVPIGILRAEVLLAGILAHLLDSEHHSLACAATGADMSARGRLNVALDHIDRFYASPLEVDELARISGLSRSHFNRTFRLATKMSPAEYITNRRLQAAREILKTSELSVKEVAGRCGFSDQFYFSRAFKRCTGLAPIDFRREQFLSEHK